MQMMSRMAVEETEIGRYEDKVIKNTAAARYTPGIEDLRTDARTGEHGLVLFEYSPFGVILMSFFFAVLSIGSKSMELSAGVSSELILIVQSIIIFFMAAEGGIRKSLSERAALRRARAEAGGRGALMGDVLNILLQILDDGEITDATAAR